MIVTSAISVTRPPVFHRSILTIVGGIVTPVSEVLSIATVLVVMVMKAIPKSVALPMTAIARPRRLPLLNSRTKSIIEITPWHHPGTSPEVQVIRITPVPKLR